MSETTTAETTATEKKNIVRLPVQSIERNGVSKTLTQFEILHGDNKDKPYLAIQVSPETLGDDIKLIGPVEVCDFLNGILKRQCQSMWFDEDMINKETGEFMMPQFLAAVAALDTGGSTLKELRDKIDEITAELTMLAMSDSSMVDGAFTQEASAEMTRLSGSIRNYKAKMEKRSKKKDTTPEASVKVS